MSHSQPDSPEQPLDPADHRALNHDLDVFAQSPLAGAGLPLLLPAGAAIRDELERLARELARADGCVEVRTPVLGKRSLFERSGHRQKFAEDMFEPIRVGGDELVLRPANCPHHALVYASRRHSWRELPVRLHEVGAMFRAERSGVVSGLSRVRQISLDDTHVFCRPDQLADEVRRALATALRAQRILGLPVDHVRLSRRDDSDGYLGSRDWWRDAEQALRNAASSVALPAGGLIEAEGEAAFYGPKLDLQVRRGGREETIATVQVDGNQPERFGLDYDAADGSRPPVVMVHRGTIGSMERVTAALLEHYRGRLPLWLAPVQVSVLPVGPGQDRGARALLDRLTAAGLRAVLEVDGSMGSRIRRCRTRRDHLVAVLGPAEEQDGSVQVNDFGADRRHTLPIDELLARAVEAYAERRPFVL